MNYTILAVLAGSLVFANSSTLTLGGLVAHFRFNDTLNDENGNHNGTMAATPSFEAGEDGNALSITDADSIVQLANPQTLEFGKDFTVSAWVQTLHPGEQVVLWRGGAAHFDSPGRPSRRPCGSSRRWLGYRCHPQRPPRRQR